MKKRVTSIGGQALIEGLLMVGPHQTKAALRRKNGNIEIIPLDRPKKDFWTSIPFVRGGVSLVRQLKIGSKALMLSAEKLEEDINAEEAKAQGKTFSPKKEENNILIYLSTLIGILGGVALFILLPNFIASQIFPSSKVHLPYAQVLAYSFVEACIRLTILVGYMALMNLQKDTKRLWQYHGAEHKTIACYEAGLPFTIENVQKQSRFHPRCGTSFLFNLIFLSIIIFSLTGWHNVWLNLLFRLAMLPVLAGISYELLQWLGKHHDSPLAHFLSMPGLMIQRLTTREPDDDQVEVSIAAMEAVLPENQKDIRG